MSRWVIRRCSRSSRGEWGHPSGRTPLTRAQRAVHEPGILRVARAPLTMTDERSVLDDSPVSGYFRDREFRTVPGVPLQHPGGPPPTNLLNVRRLSAPGTRDHR
jgi:hypothetical protein